MIHQRNNPPHLVTRKSTQTGFANGGEARARWIFCNGAKAGGFTLIELIIVLVIVAIVTTVSIPRIGAVFQAISFRRMVNNVIVFLRDARLDALSTGKKVSVVVDLKSGKFTRTSPEAGGGAKKSLSMPRGVKIEIVREDKKRGKSKSLFGRDKNIEFNFYPNGTASGPRLLLKNTGKGKNAIIYLEPLAGFIKYKIGVSDKRG